MKKESFQDKFKRSIHFVKPLYRKAKIGERDKRSVSFDRTLKLLGDDINVRAVFAKSGRTNVINIKRKQSDEYNVVLPGACDSELKINDACQDLVFRKVILNRNINDYQNTSVNNGKHTRVRKKISNATNRSNFVNTRRNLSTKANSMAVSKKIILHKMPDTWLRVYPAPKVAGEPIYSVIIRCVVCQLGLTTFLILWTIIGVFIIQSFEGPQEEKVEKDFNKEQNQLVIDLATELRQITPLSPKWKQAIEKRLEEERRLTMLAVGRGARLNPGQFWDLPGTFLFAVYVMTALGFGAPVPYTVWGRTSALIYAILAVPIHIYLMVNASTCVVVTVDEYMQKLKGHYDEKVTNVKSPIERTAEVPSHSRDTDILKMSNEWKARRGLRKVLSVFWVGRCVPLAAALYYLIGVVSFGVLRGRTALETVMFPLEFTTTGGLERVESHVRILYGIYVEGAMCLLACALATLKRHSSAALAGLTDSYRLFNTEKCKECPVTQEQKDTDNI